MSSAANNKDVSERDPELSSDDHEDYESGGAWRSTTISGPRKPPRAQYRVGAAVRVIDEKSLSYDCKMTITDRTFNEGRWGWDYRLKDSGNVRQSETFIETNLEKWR